ncbi:MAG: asparagine synthase (glutamine-hydrolyzing) [Acidobacteriota bacterium]|jgi:asparagine synthase (glutamine-hydrolysing)
MCGIAGVLKPSGHEVSEDLLKQMGLVQQHRGPDNLGLLARGNLGLVHNRLSILDLSPAGNQPFFDGKHALVFNGEIYNYKLLRAELGAAGIEVTGSSDTAVLFGCLVHRGVERTLKALRGMFAFAFANLQEGEVYLCRDRLGIKPLHWTHRAGCFYWASEVKALAAVLEVRPDPVRTLFATAGIGDHMNENTVFANLWHVPPGAYFIFRAGQPPGAAIRYYDILDDIDSSYYKELDRMPGNAVVDASENLLDRSVRAMLMSDAPMGIFVSGGVDSSLIASMATKANPELTLLTSNVIGKFSEYPSAQRLAAHLGRPLQSSPFTPEMILSDLVATTYHYEAPIVTHTNAIPFARLAGLARSAGIKAVLTGEGADELFLGYPWLLAERYRRWLLLPVNFIQALYRIVPGLQSYLLPGQEETIEGFLSLLAKGFERQRHRERGWEAYGFLDRRLIRDHYQTVQMLHEHLVSLLHRNDRMGMMASIESRFPFLDEEIIRFAVNLPLRWKSRRSFRFHDYKHPFLIDKWPVRELANRNLPIELTRKRKEGFPMFGHRYMRVKPGYFREGYVADLVGLTVGAEDHLMRTEPSSFIAKLVSVDVFGRLFERRESQSKITERILEYVSMTEN